MTFFTTDFKSQQLITICCFYILAPWRVLVIDKCGALTRTTAKHTPRKRRQEQHGKPNRKRGGAEPSPLTRLGIGCRFFRRAWLSLYWFSPFTAPLAFAFSVGYGSIVPRGSQRPQNRRLKHPYKDFQGRVRRLSLLGSFAVCEVILDLYATIFLFFR